LKLRKKYKNFKRSSSSSL